MEKEVIEGIVYTGLLAVSIPLIVYFIDKYPINTNKEERDKMLDALQEVLDDPEKKKEALKVAKVLLPGLDEYIKTKEITDVSHERDKNLIKQESSRAEIETNRLRLENERIKAEIVAIKGEVKPDYEELTKEEEFKKIKSENELLEQQLRQKTLEVDNYEAAEQVKKQGSGRVL